VRSCGVIVLILALAVCSGGATTGPSTTGSGTCRTYSTAQTGAVSSSGGLSGTIVQTCTPYNSPSNQVACTLRQTFSAGTALTQVVVGSYGSVADFVDEVKVIPPLQHLKTQTVTTDGALQQTLTFSYDAQNRPVQSVLVSPGATQTSTFSGWDTAGRYGAATLVSPSSRTQRVSYSYNDGARTMTIANASIPASTVYTYDTNGNLISTVSNASGVTTTIAVTITATDRVCK
jgi:hypothetical protein